MKIKIDSKQIDRALSNIKSLIDINKRYQDIMLETIDNQLLVCYSDSNHDFVKKVDLVETDNEPIRIIIGYAAFNDIIQKSLPSDGLGVEPIELTVTNNKLTVEVIKTLDRGEYITPVSNSIYEMVCIVDLSSPKYGLFTRTKFVELFNSPDSDTWSRQGLSSTLSRITSDERENTIFISSKDKRAKTRTLNSVSIVECECNSYGLIMKVPTANAVHSIINTMDDEINVFNDNNTVAYIWDNSTVVHFVLVKAQERDIATINLYSNAVVEEIKILVHRGAFISALRSLNSQDDRVKLDIINVDGSDYVSLSSVVNTGASNSVKVSIESFATMENINMYQYSGIISGKTLKKIFGSMGYEWVQISLNYVENRYCKITELGIDTDEAGNISVKPIGNYFPSVTQK